MCMLRALVVGQGVSQFFVSLTKHETTDGKWNIYNSVLKMSVFKHVLLFVIFLFHVWYTNF